MKLTKSERNSIVLVAFGAVLFLLVLFLTFQTSSYQLSNYAFIHTLLELASVVISLSIFIYGCLTYPIIKSRLLLLVSLSFLIIAIYDILHTITYPGMPNVFNQPTDQATLWFWIGARFTGAFTLLLMIYLKSVDVNITKKKETVLWITLVAISVSVTSTLIMAYSNSFPSLIGDMGLTPLKKGLEYLVIAIHLATLFLLWNKYKKQQNLFYLNLMRASFFLILCGLTVTFYQTIQDAILVIAHLFKIMGYFFIMKAFYYSTIQVPLLDKKQTEEKLIDVESELELLFKNTEDAIFIYNLKDKEIIRRNPAFTRMFGYDANDRLHVTCLIPPDRQFEFNKLIYQLAEGQSIVDFKTVRKREDGSYIDVSMTVSPMHNVTGELLCAAIIRDISDQTKAERELKKAKKELQEIMEEYRGLIFKFKKEKNDFVYTLMDGKVLYERNDDPKKFIGRPVQEAYQCSQGDLFNKYNERAWLGEEVEFQFEDENGMVFLTSLKPIWQQGQVTEVLGNVVDITSLIKAEELLRRTEKLSVVGELAAGFAHEIRNPLTTLKGFLQLIQLDADEKNMNYVKIMLNEIDRLEMITNEFMVVAKPQAVKYEMEDMEQMIESVTQFLQPQALLNNIEMINLVEGPLEKICCDPHQMRQVFINIYKNAMEAMPSGGMITTNLALNTNYMTISITDQGGGIPAELIPKLGEPFYTLKEKGTGLGLMVSKKIIETHGGELQIESETNVGTTMTIYLPIDSIYKGENKLLERQKEGEIV